LLNRLAALGAVVLTGVLFCVVTAPPARAQTVTNLSSLKLPLPAGTSWKVLQGYNGGTHVPGPEFYALDLVRDGGPTAGSEIVAPASGSIWFAHPPGAGNGCISIRPDGGNGLIVQMCHIVLHRVMRADERVTAGMSLGVIGEDGRVGNNGIAHLHLSMHRTPDYGLTRMPVPFSAPDGLPLEGVNMPPDGSRNQYACPGSNCISRMVSTVGLPSGPASLPSSTPPSITPPPAPIPGGVPPVPQTSPPPATPVQPVPSIAPGMPAPPGPMRTGARAVVAGAGDCVNVRAAPSTSAQVLRCLPDGARMVLQEGPVVADGYQWWRLEGQGWAVSNYLSALAPSLEIGSRARVNPGSGECLNVRIAPGRSAQSTGCIGDGTVVRVVAGPFEGDGVTWWQLEGGGWVAGEFLMATE
jgi:murein DD-endopeptidase MepM/ murein hydrolase activator NlpD